MKRSALLMDFYALTMVNVYHNFKPKAWATFDLFIRKLPKNRAFLIACGIEEALIYLRDFSFLPDDISYLKKIGFKNDFLKYLKNLRFSGDVWAVKEGTFIFPEEPILRITAPLRQAQLIEAYLLNTVNMQSMIASKAVRVVMAAGQKPVFDFSLRRTQGFDAGLKAARASYIAGCSGTSNVLAGKLYNINVIGTMAHSYIMSFDNERDSFRAYTHTFPDKSILLIDTYSYSKGIKNAIAIAKELKTKGFKLLGVRLDSGDILNESKRIRRSLDKNGFSFVKIFASGNLDEYKIDNLVKKKALIDSFGVGTNMGVSSDAPYCDVIYKISEISHASGEFVPTMKFSAKKSTYPGRKQVYRIKDRKGRFNRDVLALETEKIKGQPLLLKMMEKGRILYKIPNIKRSRDFVRQQLSELPPCYKKLKPSKEYPVRKSPGLKKLVRILSGKLKENEAHPG